MMAVCASSVNGLQNKRGLPVVNQTLGWTILRESVVLNRMSRANNQLSRGLPSPFYAVGISAVCLLQNS